MKTRLGLLALMVMAAVSAVGCGCGVAPAGGANIVNGTVTFDSVTVGSYENLTIPFKDTNPNAAETITGATLSGPDAAAFKVISTFPMDITAGGEVEVEIQFAPTHAGASSATLTLDTQAMGPSPVNLAGTGADQ